MMKVSFLVGLAAFLYCVGSSATETVQVVNDQPITEKTNLGVILRIVGSGAKCTYLAFPSKRYPDRADSQWVLKADRRSCFRSAKGDLVMTDVRAIVLLDGLPVPAGTNLTLYERPAN